MPRSAAAAFLALLLAASPALAQEATDTAPSGDEVAPVEGAETRDIRPIDPSAVRTEAREGREVEPGERRRSRHGGHGGHGRHGRHGPTLAIRSKQGGFEIDFECHAGMAACLEAIERVYAISGRHQRPAAE